MNAEPMHTHRGRGHSQKRSSTFGANKPAHRNQVPSRVLLAAKLVSLDAIIPAA